MMKEEEVERLRGLLKDCLSKHLYSSAIFFAEKVAVVTSDPADIYMQAQALFLGRQYRRALHLLNSSSIVLRDQRFRYLAAKCLEELKEWHQCLTMLADAKVDENGNVNSPKDCSPMYLDKDGEDHEIDITAAVCYLRGKAYEALENRIQAKLWYIAAVKSDPFCYEALESLLDKYMLTCEEESSLLSSLQFGKEDGWLSTIYSCLVKKHDRENYVEEKLIDIEKDNASSSSPFMLVLKNNADLFVCNAEYYYQCGDYHKCFELTSLILANDPFHMKCTVVHLAAAMELGHSNDLYLLSCNLIKDHPQRAISWFAIGCYYFSIKKYDQARKYFSKATTVDATFPPAWIGSGNAYAVQEETDQAMVAYRTAARLFPGCHLPTLYIGMEYMRTHNFKLAEQFIFQARVICPSDPLVCNELGVVAYHMKEYQKAIEWFEMNLVNATSSMNEMWEPSLVNLAHAQRKLKMYHKAVSSYKKVLASSTRNFSALAGLAYTYHLMVLSSEIYNQGIEQTSRKTDNLDAAVICYHKALRLKPEDQFCNEMLSAAVQMQASSHAPDMNVRKLYLSNYF